MSNRSRNRFWLLAGIAIGSLGTWLFGTPRARQQVLAQSPQSGPSPWGLIERRLPDQAHAMQVVGYPFANLWFAGQKGNWPLADFYVKETSCSACQKASDKPFLRLGIPAAPEASIIKFVPQAEWPQ